NWNFQDDIFALSAGSVGAFSVRAALCLVLRIEAKMHQRIVPFAGFHNDIATASAIAARRTTARNKLFAAKGNNSIHTITGFHANSGFIDEHILYLCFSSNRRSEEHTSELQSLRHLVCR